MTALTVIQPHFQCCLSYFRVLTPRDPFNTAHPPSRSSSSHIFDSRAARRALPIPVGMNTFFSIRQPATITVASTPRGEHHFAVTFTAFSEENMVSDANFAFPFGFAVSRGAAVHVFSVRKDNDDDCHSSDTSDHNSSERSSSDTDSDNDDDKKTSKTHTKTKRACSTTSRTAHT